MNRYVLPLGVLLAMVATLAFGIKRSDPHTLSSASINAPLPPFSLTHLAQPDQQFTPGQLKGQVWLLNVWASWCVSCRKEHPVLLDLAKQGVVKVVGFNYQDDRESGLKWLQKHGNPYVLTAFDADGRVGMALGVIGLPETFLIDKQGRIRYKLTGPVTPEVIHGKLLPLIRKLNRG